MMAAAACAPATHAEASLRAPPGLEAFAGAAGRAPPEEPRCPGFPLPSFARGAPPAPRLQGISDPVKVPVYALEKQIAASTVQDAISQWEAATAHLNPQEAAAAIARR